MPPSVWAMQARGPEPPAPCCTPSSAHFPPARSCSNRVIAVGGSGSSPHCAAGCLAEGSALSPSSTADKVPTPCSCWARAGLCARQSPGFCPSASPSCLHPALKDFLPLPGGCTAGLLLHRQAVVVLTLLHHPGQEHYTITLTPADTTCHEAPHISPAMAKLCSPAASGAAGQGAPGPAAADAPAAGPQQRPPGALALPASAAEHTPHTPPAQSTAPPAG